MRVVSGLTPVIDYARISYHKTCLKIKEILKKSYTLGLREKSRKTFLGLLIFLSIEQLVF